MIFDLCWHFYVTSILIFIVPTTIHKSKFCCWSEQIQVLLLESPEKGIFCCSFSYSYYFIFFITYENTRTVFLIYGL